MKNFNIALLFFLVFSTALYAQDESLRELTTDMNSISALSNGGSFYIQSSPSPELVAYEEDAYYKTEWIEGTVTSVNGEVIKDKLRFRVYDNVFELYNEGKVLDLQTGKIASVEYDDKRFETKALSLEGEAKFIYLELLHQGEKYSLYKYHKTIWLEPKYNAVMDAGRAHKQLQKKFAFYVKDQSSLIVTELARSKSKIIKQLPTCKKQTKQLKKAKLNVRREAQLVKFFELVNKKC